MTRSLALLYFKTPGAARLGPLALDGGWWEALKFSTRKTSKQWPRCSTFIAAIKKGYVIIVVVWCYIWCYMQSWSSKAPNGRIQQHKHTKHAAKNDQSWIWAHSRIVQLHCMFSASEYPHICFDYWLFYQLYSTSSLFLKNFASQSSMCCWYSMCILFHIKNHQKLPPESRIIILPSKLSSNPPNKFKHPTPKRKVPSGNLT